MILRLSDFEFEIDNIYPHSEIKTRLYATEPTKIDYSFKITKEHIEYERLIAEEEFSPAFLELSAIYREISEWLPLKDAFVLHSACFDVDGDGVAFAAHSGTGKTTHMMRWLGYLGDKATVVNGDKPIVRFIDGIFYAYGTPWMGKEKLGCNMRTPLKHICFIERSETNYVEQLDKSNAVQRIFNQVYMPKDPMAAVKTMQLIDRLLSYCNLWIIHCNMDEDAGKIAYKAIFNNE